MHHSKVMFAHLDIYLSLQIGGDLVELPDS